MKMNIYSKITLLLIYFSLAGCESEEILTPDFVHEEYIVVQAEIQANKVFPSVRFTKTLPLGVPYKIEDAELKNVTAYIKKNGVQIIPLIYTMNGLYKPLYEFYVDEGDTYELFADRDGVYIYSKTRVPYEPEIINTSYNPNEHYLTAEVPAKDNEVYAALWVITTTPAVKAEDYFSVYSGSLFSNVSVRTSPLPEEYRSNAYLNNRYIQVFAFDESFRDYFSSRTSGSEINDPFVQGGSEINWNVQGDNIIGLFIGTAAAAPHQVF
jgi:hypothetical protein